MTPGHSNRLTLVALALGLASTVATAETVYDTLGPTNSYDAMHGWFFGDPDDMGTNFVTASAFTPSASGYLSGVTLALNFEPAVPFGLLAQVRLDAAGAPGAAVAQVSHVPTAPISIPTIGFGNPFWLNRGQTYWLSISADTPDPQTFASWFNNVAGFVGAHAFSGAAFQPPGEWFVYANVIQPAYRVTTSPVPEAPTGLLLAAGTLLIATRMRILAKAQG